MPEGPAQLGGHRINWDEKFQEQSKQAREQPCNAPQSAFKSIVRPQLNCWAGDL